MSTPFLRDYQPPFPSLTVEVHSDDAHTGPHPALVDTGSDATLIPVSILLQIGAAESTWAVLRTQLGDSRRVPRYLVSIQIGKNRLPGLYAVGDEVGAEIILGRDVLNKLPLFLDGPQHQTDVLDDTQANRLRARRAEPDA